MPTYRFEFVDEPETEPVYVDLDNDDAARSQARQALAEAMLDQSLQNQKPFPSSVKVYDAAGFILATVTIEDRLPEQLSGIDRPVEVSDDLTTLMRDGIVGRKAAFSRDFADAMREDMMTAFWAAIQRPGGAIGRGPRRWYVEIHPQEFGGFIELTTHPWIVAMCEATLGADYQIVEIGFDTPFQGARNQPWHRDFPSPPDTYDGGRITSLAFNLTGVDVTPDMGPFEIAPGTQFIDGREWEHEMFPPKEAWDEFAQKGVRKFPQMGDVSCRSALTIHRGTAHPSPIARPVMVLGVDSPGAGHAELHDLMVTQEYYDALPRRLRHHLVCRIVDKLVPVTQKHDIEGLVMGAD